MVRPKKDKQDRKITDLRIPLTESQKQLIADAARLEQMDLAAWARPILLEAAKKRIEEEDEKKS